MKISDSAPDFWATAPLLRLCSCRPLYLGPFVSLARDLILVSILSVSWLFLVRGEYRDVCEFPFWH